MYIDVLFVLNFMMDAMALLISSEILADTALPLLLRGKRGFGPGIGKILLGALAGALAGCVLTVAAKVYGVTALEEGVGAVFSGLGICGLMIGIAFHPKSLRSWIRQIVTVYATAFLTGGILDFVRAHTGAGQYFAAVAVSFFLLSCGRAVYVRLKEQTSLTCSVHIQTEGGTIRLRGLLDTGNLLTVPILGTPVSVASAQVLLDGLSEERQAQYAYIRKNHQIPEGCEKDWYLIPFHSVGCEKGLLPVLAVPHICLQTEREERVLARAMIGICEYPLSAPGRYDMILNPKLVYA